MLSLCCFVGTAAAAESRRVTLLRTPDGGIQPQAAADSQGTVHLIYYKGEAAGGDLFYVRRAAGAESFSKPIQVNSVPGSAIAAGTIRGAQLALGRDARVHVVWNGGQGAKKVPIQGKDETPLLYTRWNDAGTAFEPERNLITYAGGLDGGSSVAADALGNVYVTWHGSPPENRDKEAGRAVFVARSRDDGKTFAREMAAAPKKTGACGCCGMRAFADRNGATYILYRAATDNLQRDELLLVSPRPGEPFQIAFSHPWKATTCPMSSSTLGQTRSGVLAAWETASEVYFAHFDASTMKVSTPTAPPTRARRKHPVAVANENGETLFVWTEGTGWARGGAVAWQLYEASGKPAAEQGRTDGVPMWSLATAFANPDGTFVIVY